MSQLAAKKYKELEDLLISGRTNGTFSQDADDAISDAMADCWYQMSRSERDEVKLRSAQTSPSIAVAFANVVSKLISSTGSPENNLVIRQLPPTFVSRNRSTNGSFTIHQGHTVSTKAFSVPRI